MAHALIVNDKMIISRAIRDRLSNLGFDSFDHTFTEGQALSVAKCRKPDLVVVGDTVIGSASAVVADHIFETFGSPIVRLASGRCEVRKQVLQGETVTGPFSLTDIGAAIAVACPKLVADMPTDGGLAAEQAPRPVMQAA